MVALRSSRFWLFSSLVGLLTFALLAVLYTGDGLLQRVDFWLGDRFHYLYDHAGAWIVSLMKGVSLFGRELVVAMGIAGGAYLLWRRSWRELLLWVSVLAGAVLLNRVLKEYFEAVRPMVGHDGVVEHSTGFPSGHTMMATVTYGLLAFLATLRETRQRFTWAIWCGAGLLVAVVSFSRLYLTYHYLSDVLGGITLGVAWFALCLGLFCLLNRVGEQPWFQQRQVSLE